MAEKAPEQRERSSLFELVQEAYKNRRTGLIRRSHRGLDIERYFVVKGELYLPRDHPLSLSIERQLLGKSAKSAAHDLHFETQPVDTGNVPRTILESGLRILVEILADERSIGFEYERGATEIPMNVVGPLPTAELLMESSVRGLDEFDLLRRLGGEDGLWVAPPGELEESGPDLEPEQAFLLSRASEPITVRELLRQAEIEREIALSMLVRLAAVGMIESGSGQRAPSRGTSEPKRRSGIVQRLEERVGDELSRRPLKLDPDDHRSRILEYLGSYGEKNFYDLLGVGVQVSPEEVHAAYSDRARITHPVHADTLGLKGGAAPLRVLFETLTDAYLTLSDADRRRAYQMKLGSGFSAAGGVSDEERAEEQVEVAQRNYTIAAAKIRQEDYHSAIELLELAVKNDPKAEYLTLLADCQARNPHWLSRARQNYERALELDGESVEARKGLARVLDAAGQTQAAQEQLKLLKAIDQDAANEVAETVAEGKPGKSGKGLFGRLLSSLRGGDDVAEPVESAEPKHHS